MAREIIVLDVSQATQGQKAVRVAFWFPIAQAAAYQKPSFNSAVDGTLAAANSGQVTTAELNSLRAGTTLEEVYIFTFAQTYTNAQIKSDLQQLWTDRNTAVQNLPNPIAFYGVSFDSVTGWSA